MPVQKRCSAWNRSPAMGKDSSYLGNDLGLAQYRTMDATMIAARVTESYASLFLRPNGDDGSRNTVIAMVGAFEVRLVGVPSVNAPAGLSLWVELYCRDIPLGVDSCKCNNLDEAIEAATLLAIQAGQLNNETARG
jgi:hypothetical protein